MSLPKPGAVDSFEAVLRTVVAATGWPLIVLADKLGVSTKTISRYYHGGAMPPPARRHGIVHSLSGLDPALLGRLIASLGLTADFPHGAPRAPVSHEVAVAAAESAVAELSENLDAGPAKSRAAVVRLLARLADANVDVETARAALAKR